MTDTEIEIIESQCFCCGSQNFRPAKYDGHEYMSCRACGLLVNAKEDPNHTLNSIKHHYKNVDPYKDVADSKIFFFNSVLNYLKKHINKSNKSILDVGCGFGYFLQHAVSYGWKTTGVEIVDEAVEQARKSLGNKCIFAGYLNESAFPKNSFDAVTIMDVIAVDPDPYALLNETFRVLTPGGFLGIRTRNLFFQKILYQIYHAIPYLKITDQKKPYVFNKFCFSRRSLEQLLLRIGFVNIQITNSEMTKGNPYGSNLNSGKIRTSKFLVNYISKLIFFLSNGKLTCGPSLLAWAQKP